ncbi:hypothetical protein GGE65_008363 [Skermanella aerolata]|uniref:hypothetical protein n=1 Tax=Skermanella aerolata TaxID=393310 RepID=UPI003D1B7151
MSNRISYRHNPLWDYRVHPSRGMAFRCDEGQDLDDIKRRALRVLYDHSHHGGTGTDGIEGPLWALVDVSHGNERVKNACQWFRVAAAYSDDEEERQACCIEAYGWIERALRCYL